MKLAALLMVVVFLQVALDVIEELCYEMGLQRLEALDEYAIFLVTHRGNCGQVKSLAH